MQYLFLKSESEKYTNMSCDSSRSLNKDAEVVANLNYFQKFRLKKSKRYRSAFTTEQINYLEQEFKKFPYIGNTNRKEVANVLEISERAVKIWFQNRRMKEKREVNGGNRESLLEDKNNIYNTLSKELLNNRSMKSNNYFSYNESLLSNQREKSKESTIKNPKTNYTSNEEHFLPNQIKVKSFKNNKIYNNKHKRTVDFTKDNSNSNMVKSIIQPKMKSETTNLQPAPLKLINKNTHFNVNKGFTCQERNAIPCHSKRESDVAQDLTISNTVKKEYQQYYPAHSKIDQRFVPFYTQGYYAPQQATSTFHSGNIVWKPVNVMPMPIPGLAACSPLSITNNCSGMSSNNQILSKGTCICHGPPHIFNARSQCVAATQPQYILAFPVGNSSNKI